MRIHLVVFVEWIAGSVPGNDALGLVIGAAMGPDVCALAEARVWSGPILPQTKHARLNDAAYRTGP
jgi:hypothetical protein